MVRRSVCDSSATISKRFKPSLSEFFKSFKGERKGKKVRPPRFKKRKLSRAISDLRSRDGESNSPYPIGLLGWREFRTMLDNKADKHGRKFTVIDRREPTTQTCSCCRQKGGKKELSIREWTCLWCGETHDRDINASINIEVAGGHPETVNGRGGTGKISAKEAPSDEASTAPEWIQLDLFGESPSL